MAVVKSEIKRSSEKWPGYRPVSLEPVKDCVLSYKYFLIPSSASIFREVSGSLEKSGGVRVSRDRCQTDCPKQVLESLGDDKFSKLLEKDIRILRSGSGCREYSRIGETKLLINILIYGRTYSEKMRHFEILVRSCFAGEDSNSLMASLNLHPDYENLNSHTKRLDKFKKDTGKSITVKTLMAWERRSIKQLAKYIIGLLKDDFFEDTIKYGAHT